MRKIYLTNGQFALVDDEDYDKLKSYNWYAYKKSNTVYAIGYKRGITGHAKMHRIVMGNPYRKPIHHINHNGLDNRKKNLLVCTCAENNRNRRPYKDGTSKYKGVSWDKQYSKWLADIRIDNVNKRIGRYKTEKDAARAYDKKAQELFGEFAYLNFRSA